MKENFVVFSQFNGNAVDFHTRGVARFAVFENKYHSAKQPNDISKESVIRTIQDAAKESGFLHVAVDDLPTHPNIEPSPVGARKHLAGRENIIMTEWGPWDHVSPRK